MDAREVGWEVASSLKYIFLQDNPNSNKFKANATNELN